LRHCRQIAQKAPYRRPDRGARPQLRQSVDPGEAQLGTLDHLDRWTAPDLRLDQQPSDAQRAKRRRDGQSIRRAEAYEHSRSLLIARTHSRALTAGRFLVKRLVYICDWLPPDFGAVGQYSEIFAREWARDGWAVILVGLTSG